MEVNCVGHLKAFRTNTFNDIANFGIGHIVTEHIPDNMNHGNHTKAVIGQMSRTVEEKEEKDDNGKKKMEVVGADFYVGFENPITEKQMSNLNMKSSYSETHSNKKRLATNGDGVKQLFSLANKVIIYNIIENEEGYYIITEKEIEIGEFFKEARDDGSNYKEVLQNCTTTKSYDSRKEKQMRSCLIKSQYESYYDKFFNKIKSKFNNKLPPFGYIVEFDGKGLPDDNDLQSKYVLEQKEMINNFELFLKEGCHEIQMKNSVSNYKLYYVTNKDEEIVMSEIDKFDPTKYNDRRQCLTTFFKFYNNETSGGNIKKYVDFWIKDDKKNRKYTRSITDGYNPKRNQIVEEADKNQINGKLEIYYIDSNKYDEKIDADNRGGWIFLEESNGENILVNLKAISTDFINKKYGRNGDDFFRSLRIVAHLKDSDYFDTDGRKFLSNFSKYLESLIRHIFEKVYKSGDFYARNPTNRPWKKGKESSRFNAFRDIENITELLDNCSDNLERALQGKQAKPAKSSRKKSPKVNNMFGGNKKISPPKVKTDDDVNKVVTQELQTLNTQQYKRHTKPGGWIYVWHNPDSRKGENINKIGFSEDWRSRMRKHQQQHPCERLTLIKLLEVEHDIRQYETNILHTFQNHGILMNPFSKKPEHFYTNKEGVDWYYEITNQLPNSFKELDVDLLWNNVKWEDMVISDDEVAPSGHQEE